MRTAAATLTSCGKAYTGRVESESKIEHRLFSVISKNWRGQPLASLQVIVNLIAGTTTQKGLKVHAEIDTAKYPAGVKVPDSEMAEIRLQRHAFPGEWNYHIPPRK